MTHTKHRKRRERYIKELGALTPIYDQLMRGVFKTTHAGRLRVSEGLARTGRAG